MSNSCNEVLPSSIVTMSVFGGPAAAEVAAANARKGIWQQEDRDAWMPPGKLIFPGIRTLAEFERMAENAHDPKPPPTYGPEKPEADLLSIFSGDDLTASFAARSELLRRAKSGELSRMAFSSLIAVGLDEQLLGHWEPFYGSLIQLACQQEKLAEALLKRYARQAISLQFIPRMPLFLYHIIGKQNFQFWNVDNGVFHVIGWTGGIQP